MEKATGYIYKIFNDVNQKLYIGKTLTTIEDRFQKHIYSITNNNESEYPLHRAMKKHGVKKFHVELIEECAIEILNNREKYWINYYDSYHNGYNATLGGEGNPIYDHNLIVQYIQQGKTRAEITQIVGCSIDTVTRTAKSMGISLQKKKVQQFDKKSGELLNTFNSMREAAEAAVYPNLDKLRVERARKAISNNCRGDSQSAYGFQWKYLKF